MRAWTYERYGSIDELRLSDVPTPAPAPDEVLIRVAATSVNLSDWEGLRGSPAYARIGGLRAPRRRILGSDIAGVVEVVGDRVTRFRVGDEVYGDNIPRSGGFAEYATMRETALALKPPELTFVEAAAIPQSGAIASQAVALGTPGQRMLLNGAGGGSGSLAVQLAVADGIHVTAVDNAGKLGFLRGLGAHEVIDYDVADFTTTGPYDVIVDLVANRSVLSCRRALARGGRYRMVGGSVRTMLGMLTFGQVVGTLSGASLGVLLVKEGPAHFASVAGLVAAGRLRLHIDRVMPFAQVPQALRLHGEGKALGKVVVTTSD